MIVSDRRESRLDITNGLEGRVFGAFIAPVVVKDAICNDD